MIYTTYILLCSDNTYYTGYTNNIENRIKTHNLGKGAKYTRGRIPVKLIYKEEFTSEGNAKSREYEIKQLTRKQKEYLIKKSFY